MSEEIREGFIRQRRNLMVISVVVFFAQYVGLEFDQINFLGNQADITDSGSVMVFLWILLIYWLFRYSAYLHDLGDLKVKSQFMVRRKAAIENILRGKGLTEIEKNEILFSANASARDPFQGHSINAKNKSPDRYRLVNELSIRLNGIDVSGEEYLSVSGKKSYHITDDDFSVWVEFGFSLAKVDLWISNINASYYLLVKTRAFSEYAFPFLVALVPIAYWLYETWATVPFIPPTC